MSAEAIREADGYKGPEWTDLPPLGEGPVGLLVIHGIGSQPRGAVITSACDSIVEWLRYRHEDTHASTKVLYEQAVIRPQDLGTVVPPHARFTVGARKYLVVESRWAQSFIAPAFGRILPWTLLSVMRTAARDASELIGGSHERVKHPTIWGVHPFRFNAGYGTSWLYRQLKASILLALLPLALIAMLMVTALSVVPPVRRWAARLQSLLSATIGDSFVFVAGLTGRAAIVEQVHADLKWLAHSDPTPSRIVVVAHSQGAAVAHAALDSFLPDLVDPMPPIELVTYGSGISKLGFLGERRPIDFLASVVALISGVVTVAGFALLARGTRSAWVAHPWLSNNPLVVAFIVAGIALGAWLFLVALWTISILKPSMRSERSPVPLWTTVWTVGALGLAGWFLQSAALPGVVAIFAGYLIALILMYRKDRPADGVIQPRTPRAARRWIDVQSSADLVAGALPDARLRPVGGNPEPDRLVVHNLRSAVFDHTSYWQNWAEFVPMVIAMMRGDLRGDGAREVPPAWLHRERSRRYEETYLLVSLRALVTIVCLAALIAALNYLSWIGKHALTLVIKVLNTFPGPPYSYVDSDAWFRVAGLVTIIVGFAVIYRSVAAFWHSSDNRERKRNVTELRAWDACPGNINSWAAACPGTLNPTISKPNGLLVLILGASDDRNELQFFPDADPTSPRAIWRGVTTKDMKIRVRKRWALCLKSGAKDDLVFTTRRVRSLVHLQRVAASTKVVNQSTGASGGDERPVGPVDRAS